MNNSKLIDLYSARNYALGLLDDAKARLAEINDLIMAATKSKAEQMYALTGKDFGAVTIDGGDGIAIKANISKKVEWDSAKLIDITRTMPWDIVRENFNIKMSMPEKVYKSLGDTSKRLYDQARTVKYGEIEISLEKK